jgi:hypothetical protein
MLRVVLCIAVFVLSGTTVWAAPLNSPASASSEAPTRSLRHPIDLSSFRGLIRPYDGDESAVFSPHDHADDNPTGEQGLTLGPLHVGGGDGNMAGKHRKLARFRVEGVTVFGGSVSGNLDGRSANIVLSWPTGS